jgi:hypothetical protein
MRGQSSPVVQPMVAMILLLAGFLILFSLYMYFSKSTTGAADNILFGALERWSN